MRPGGTEKIGGGRRFENKLDFIGDRGEYPELSLLLWRLSVGLNLCRRVASPAKSDVESDAK